MNTAVGVWVPVHRNVSETLYHPSAPGALPWLSGWPRVLLKYLCDCTWSQSHQWRSWWERKNAPITRAHTQRLHYLNTQNVIRVTNWSLTISKRRRTSFSDSPLYLEVRVDEETLKNVVLHSVATALAKSVFPVPGGPTIRTPYGKEMKKNQLLCRDLILSHK